MCILLLLLTTPKEKMKIIYKALCYIKRRLQADRAYRELQSLSDRELQDIGISRSDIPHLVHRSCAK